MVSYNAPTWRRNILDIAIVSSIQARDMLDMSRLRCSTKCTNITELRSILKGRHMMPGPLFDIEKCYQPRFFLRTGNALRGKSHPDSSTSETPEAIYVQPRSLTFHSCFDGYPLVNDSCDHYFDPPCLIFLHPANLDWPSFHTYAGTNTMLTILPRDRVLM